MRGSRVAGAAALGMALCLAAPVSAQPWEESGSSETAGGQGGLGIPHTGFYGAVGGFLATSSGRGFNHPEGAGGFTARAGLRPTGPFAGEFVLDWVEGFDRAGGSELETLFFGLNGKGYLPLQYAPILRYAQPYLQLGLGYFHVGLGHQDFDDGAMRMGFGFDIPITRHFGAGLEFAYLWAWDETDGADYAQFGASVQYWF